MAAPSILTKTQEEPLFSDTRPPIKTMELPIKSSMLYRPWQCLSALTSLRQTSTVSLMRLPSSLTPPPQLSSFSSSSSSSSLSLMSPLVQCKDTCSDIDAPPIQISSDDADQESAIPSLEKLGVKSFWESKMVARLLLLLVPVFWGTYGPAVRFVYEQPHPPSPSVLTLARKALSLVFFFCFLPLDASINPLEHSANETGSQEEDAFRMDNRPLLTANQGFFTDLLGLEWFAAIELGLWTFLGTACQTDGLENTSATRAGFLLQSVTVLVPLLSIFSGIKVKSITWAATVFALLGVTSMSVQFQYDASSSLSWSTLLSSFALSRGDLEILLAAFFYALCTVRLSNYAAKIQAVALSTNLMVVSTILAALWVLFDHTGALSTELHLLSSQNIVLAIVFSALVPGTLASLAQTIGQKTISPAEAQVYFSLQPFYSAIFAAAVLSENIDNTTWVAGTALVVAALIASFETLVR